MKRKYSIIKFSIRIYGWFFFSMILCSLNCYLFLYCFYLHQLHLHTFCSYKHIYHSSFHFNWLIFSKRIKKKDNWRGFFSLSLSQQEAPWTFSYTIKSSATFTTFLNPTSLVPIPRFELETFDWKSQVSIVKFFHLENHCCQI